MLLNPRLQGCNPHLRILQAKHGISRASNWGVFVGVKLKTGVIFQVGDFWYLLLRIRTENTAVLNREYQEHYKLKVRGTLQQKSRKLYDVHCDVLVTILDKNDISPLFYPKTYNVTISEMTPLFQNVLKVSSKLLRSNVYF